MTDGRETHQRLATAAARHLTARIERRRAARVSERIRLRDAYRGDVVVGHLGGEAALPEDRPWPGGERPYEHVLTLDLAALPRTELELPEDGRLLFFRDPRLIDAEVLHVPAGTAVVRRRPPRDSDAVLHRRVDLAAKVEPSFPDKRHPYTRGQLDVDDPGLDAGSRVVWWDEVTHHLGGYGGAIGYEPDFAPSAAAAGIRFAVDGDPEPELPVLLAQIDADGDSGINWGDEGTSHWIIDREALLARRFEETRLRWSCW